MSAQWSGGDNVLRTESRYVWLSVPLNTPTPEEMEEWQSLWNIHIRSSICDLIHLVWCYSIGCWVENSSFQLAGLTPDVSVCLLSSIATVRYFITLFAFSQGKLHVLGASLVNTLCVALLFVTSLFLFNTAHRPVLRTCWPRWQEGSSVCHIENALAVWRSRLYQRRARINMM